MRLDIYLVEKEYFKSRSRAKEEIKNNNIYINNKCINKPSYIVLDDDLVEVRGDILKYVSRAGKKLEHALDVFKIDLNDKEMLDIGSSTGGFTDCALQNNIKHVIAVDVGTNQMVESIKNDNRVTLYENTDIRNIDLDIINNVDIVTIDVSFISVTKFIDKISNINHLKEIICLIKPQFECGKEIADKYKGIILNKDIHYNIINNIMNEFKKYNFFTNGLSYSPIRGGDGNIEYLLYLTKEKSSNIDINVVINNAFKL